MFPVKRFALFSLLVTLSIAWSMPIKAQEGMTGAEYGRQTQIEAKKAAKQQRKLMKKALKQQQKAREKYLKAQRRAAKNANQHAR
jgi:hypothetical protein